MEDSAQAASHADDAPAVQLFLQPVAAPSVLGHFGGATGFLLFGVWLSGAVGGADSALTLLPFVLLLAGVAQMSAGVWSVRARDAVGATVFILWGGFWIAYAFLWLMDATHLIALPAFGSGFEPLGQWFIYMAVATWSTAFAALARGPLPFAGQAIAAVASTIAAAGLITGAPVWQQISGWVFVAAAAVFSYHPAATMINAHFEKVILPHGTWRREENRIGGRPLEPVAFEQGEPGVRVGQ